MVMRKRNSIPKIIHQTWKDNQIPYPLDQVAKTWQEMLPDWEYHLWTDEENREFVKTNFPDFLSLYDAYPNKIQRADAIRYLLLKTYGGLYIDLDFECLDPKVTTLFDGAEFVAGKEPYWHAQRFGMDYIVCNAFMASVPDNDFLNFVCDFMMHAGGRTVANGFDILNTTGPFMLTNAYKAYPHKESVRILEPEFLYPIGQWEVEKIKQNRISNEMAERINHAYAIHYFMGSWYGG